MKKTKEQKSLERQLETARKEYRRDGESISKLQDELNRRFIYPGLKKHIGKCYKFLNGNGLDEKWWLYRRIVDVDDGNYRTITIEETRAGLIKVEERNWDSDATSFYTEITRAEYNRAVAPILKRLNARVKP